jgi:hypothetical protein
MAIVQFIGGLWTPWLPPVEEIGDSAALGVVRIDAASEKIAFILTCPRSGTLDMFEVNTGAVSLILGSVARYSFQGVNANGLPDGVVDQYRERPDPPFVDDFEWVAPGLMTDDGTDTGVKRTVVRGEQIACVVDFSSFVAGDYYELQHLVTTGGGYNATNAEWHYTGSWAEQTSALPIVVLKYDDGDYPFLHGCFPIHFTSYQDISSAEPANGMAFSLPAPMLVAGATIRTKATSGSVPTPVEVVLYDKDGQTELEVIQIPTALTERYYTVVFSQDRLLAANEVYRLVLRSTSASVYVRVYYYILNSAAILSATEAGENFYYTAGEPGSWVDQAENRPWMSLLVSGIDHDISGGGGGGGFEGTP